MIWHALPNTTIYHMDNQTPQCTTYAHIYHIYHNRYICTTKHNYVLLKILCTTCTTVHHMHHQTLPCTTYTYMYHMHHNRYICTTKYTMYKENTIYKEKLYVPHAPQNTTMHHKTPCTNKNNIYLVGLPSTLYENPC